MTGVALLARRGSILHGVVAFAASYLLLLRFLAADVGWRDAGELIAASYHLSPAHFLGYPMYVMPAKLASLVPVGSIPLRVNWMNTVLGALTLTFTFLGSMAWVARLGIGRADRRLARFLVGVGLVAVVVRFGSQGAFLQEAASAENTMPALFLCSAIWFALSAARPPRLWKAYGVACLLAAYHPAFLIAPAVILPVMLLVRGALPARGAAVLLLLIPIACQGINLFLVLRSGRAIPLTHAGGESWADVRTTLEFGGEKLRGVKVGSELTGPMKQRAAAALAPPGAWPLLALGAMGVAWLAVRLRYRILGAVPVAAVLLLLAGTSPSQERGGYGLFLSISTTWLCGLGLCWLATREARRWAVAGLALAGGYALWLAGSQGWGRLARGSVENRVPRSLVNQVFSELSPGSLLVCLNERNAFALQEATWVERRRPDVALAFVPIFTTEWGRRRFLDLYSALVPPPDRQTESPPAPSWMSSSLRYAGRLAKANIGERPVFSDQFAHFAPPRKADPALAGSLRPENWVAGSLYHSYIIAAASGLDAGNLERRFSAVEPAYGRPKWNSGLLFGLNSSGEPPSRSYLLRPWDEKEELGRGDLEVLGSRLLEWGAFEMADGRFEEAARDYRAAGDAMRAMTQLERRCSRSFEPACILP
ncbi:MAG: DUF2723 domain-containing protein [Nitrospirae bacterium]|nr:DUF2723 domain-containing protein [Nitrospirota bacterium]